MSGIDGGTEQRNILKFFSGSAIVLLFSEFDPLSQSHTCSVLICICIQVYASYSSSSPFLIRTYTTWRPETIKYAPPTGPTAKEVTNEERRGATRSDNEREEIPELSLPMTPVLLV